MEVQLHWFSDASQSAYGGVIYLRTLYTDTSVSVTLLTAKTREATLKKLTIPHLELCGALLTARLLKTYSCRPGDSRFKLLHLDGLYNCAGLVEEYTFPS